MNTKKKTRPVAGTTEREAAEMTACRASIPISNYNTTAADRQLKIAYFLGAGQKNAVPLRILEKLTGFDGRTVRRLIANERLTGTPILADNQTGYFLPANEDERRRCVHSMTHRAHEIAKAAEAIAAATVHEGARPAPNSVNSAAEQECIPGWLDA